MRLHNCYTPPACSCANLCGGSFSRGTSQFDPDDEWTGELKNPSELFHEQYGRRPILFGPWTDDLSEMRALLREWFTKKAAGEEMELAACDCMLESWKSGYEKYWRDTCPTMPGEIALGHTRQTEGAGSGQIVKID